MRGPLPRTLLACATAGALLAACSSPSGPSSATTAPPLVATASATGTGPVATTPELATAVAAPGDGRTLVAVTRGGGGTVVTTIDRASGAVLGRARLDGAWSLPEPVAGGGPEGITPSAAAVVLVADEPDLPGAADRPATPADRRPRFAVVTPGGRTPPRLVELPATFGYDAVSPDGGRLYLVESLPPKGSEHYQVRWYDVAAGRLDEAVVVDKTHLDEWMAGHPVGRVTSPDGTVVATLYDRTDGEPFVHVLHTGDVFAQCIDLPAAARGLRLAAGVPTVDGDGAVLHLVDDAGSVRFAVDLASGRVTPGAGR